MANKLSLPLLSLLAWALVMAGAWHMVAALVAKVHLG